MKGRKNEDSAEFEKNVYNLRISREPIKTPEVLAFVAATSKQYAKLRPGVNEFVRLIATKPRK
jgi:hypothetical protein